MYSEGPGIPQVLIRKACLTQTRKKFQRSDWSKIGTAPKLNQHHVVFNMSQSPFEVTVSQTLVYTGRPGELVRIQIQIWQVWAGA